MTDVLLFGGTGNIGRAIAAALKESGYRVTAVVRNEGRAHVLEGLADRCLIADVTSPGSLKDICGGYDIVISALGKSVSPNDKSKPTFEDVDLGANSYILEEAVKSSVRKFVYVSALGSEKNLHLNYFRTHYLFEEKLKASGMDFAIVKPPAVFCAFTDLIAMAKKGRLVTMGKGDKMTNPIYEGDLARICVEAIQKPDAIIEAGGPEVLSRKQINEIIQRAVNPAGKVRSVPFAFIKAGLPVLKWANPNLYDKMAFFTAVMQEDTLATRSGKMTLNDYMRKKVFAKTGE